MRKKFKQRQFKHRPLRRAGLNKWAKNHLKGYISREVNDLYEDEFGNRHILYKYTMPDRKIYIEDVDAEVIDNENEKSFVYLRLSLLLKNEVDEKGNVVTQIKKILKESQGAWAEKK